MATSAETPRTIDLPAGDLAFAGEPVERQLGIFQVDSQLFDGRDIAWSLIHRVHLAGLKAKANLECSII